MCVGSLAELQRAVRRRAATDPHRPFVDDVTFTRAGRGRRLPPGPAGHRRLVRLRLDAVRAVRRAAPQRRAGRSAAYPADFICEAIDQTRGWFYTLMAVGTLVFEQSLVPQRRLPRATSWPRTAAR